MRGWEEDCALVPVQTCLVFAPVSSADPTEELTGAEGVCHHVQRVEWWEELVVMVVVM